MTSSRTPTRSRSSPTTSPATWSASRTARSGTARRHREAACIPARPSRTRCWVSVSGSVCSRAPPRKAAPRVQGLSRLGPAQRRPRHLLSRLPNQGGQRISMPLSQPPVDLAQVVLTEGGAEVLIVEDLLVDLLVGIDAGDDGLQKLTVEDQAEVLDRIVPGLI